MVSLTPNVASQSGDDVGPSTPAPQHIREDYVINGLVQRYMLEDPHAAKDDLLRFTQRWVSTWSPATIDKHAAKLEGLWVEIPVNSGSGSKKRKIGWLVRSRQKYRRRSTARPDAAAQAWTVAMTLSIAELEPDP